MFGIFTNIWRHIPILVRTEKKQYVCTFTKTSHRYCPSYLKPVALATTEKVMDHLHITTEHDRKYICCYDMEKYLYGSGVRGGAVGWGTALQTGRSQVRFPMVPLKFFIDTILLIALWHWGWLSLQQKWVTGIIPGGGGKGGRCIGLTTLPPYCAECLEIWKPQPPGTLRDSPGL
jgi:hypothetical protein